MWGFPHPSHTYRTQGASLLSTWPVYEVNAQEPQGEGTGQHVGGLVSTRLGVSLSAPRCAHQTLAKGWRLSQRLQGFAGIAETIASGDSSISIPSSLPGAGGGAVSFNHLSPWLFFWEQPQSGSYLGVPKVISLV